MVHSFLRVFWCSSWFAPSVSGWTTEHHILMSWKWVQAEPLTDLLLLHPKISLFLSRNYHLFFFLPPSDHTPGPGQRGNRKCTSSEAAGVSHIRSISAARLLFCFVFSSSPSLPAALVHLWGPGTNVAMCANTWVEHTFARCTCAHASVHSLSSKISLPPVPQQGRAPRSAQALLHNNKHEVGQIFIWQRCSLCSVVIAGRFILAQPMQPFHRNDVEWISFCEIASNILTVGVIH